MSKTIRIFISSPGDVVEERQKASLVIQDLQRQYLDVELKPVLWEELPLPATASFQETIDLVLKQQPIDIAVFILWARLGSRLGAAVIKPDGSEYQSGTEREFDLMLHAYKQSDGQRPVILAYTRDDEQSYRRKRCEIDDDDEVLQMIKQRRLVQSFVREQFHDGSGCNIRAYHSYREPLGFAQSLRTHLRNVLSEIVGAANMPRWSDSPFQSLSTFKIEHSPIFFGREDESNAILQRLRDRARDGCAFVVIVGASGSGKSSLAMAGVAASLINNPEEAREWKVAKLTPSLMDGDLVVNLAQTVASEFPISAAVALLDAIDVALGQGQGKTAEQCVLPTQEHSTDGESTTRLLLILDQLEELWTDRDISEEQRIRFFAAVEALSKSGRVSCLATLRADFYSQAQQVPEFLRLKAVAGQYDLVAPNSAALLRMIREPARMASVRFEQDLSSQRRLDELIHNDASRDPSALPLLEYALAELYDRRNSNGELTFEAYEELGGLEGAIASRADETFQGLTEAAQDSLPEILPLLVTIEATGKQTAVRRRANLSELTSTPGRRILTDALVKARFLTTDKQGDDSVASFTHEALLDRWSQVADWIEINERLLLIRTRVEQNQKRWRESGENQSLLLASGLPIEEARQLLDADPNLLSPESRDYIKTSITYHEAVQNRRRRRTRIVVACISALSVLATVAAGLAYRQMRVASIHEAAANQRLAELRKQTDEASEALFHFGISEYEDGKFTSSTENLHRAWRLRRDNDPLKNSYANVLIDRLTHGGRSWITVQHGSSVRSVEFSRDGNYVASASGKNVRIWKAESGLLIGPPLQHATDVHKAVFSPDGTKIATACEDTAIVWSIETGEKLGSAMRHSAWVNDIVFSPDGKRLATSTNGNDATVWEVSTSKPLAQLRHAGSVSCIAFSADGSRAVTGSFDQKAYVWDVLDYTPVGRPIAHDAYVTSVEFSPDGKLVASASADKTARLSNPESGELVGEIMRHDWEVHDLSFSPDGRHLATASSDKTARLWDGSTGAPVGKPMQHDEAVHQVEFSPDGLRLASVSGRTTRIWNVRTRQPVGHGFHHEKDIADVSFSPNGTFLATASGDRTARLWNVQSELALHQSIRRFFPVNAIAYSPDGARLATTSQRTLQIWEAKTGRPIGKPMQLEEDLHHVAFSSDGTRLATASGTTAQVWDVSTQQAVGQTMRHGTFAVPVPTPFDTSSEELPNLVFRVAFSPDGAHLATACNDHSVWLWDVQSGDAVSRLTGHKGLVSCVLFRADGNRLATASADGTVQLWDFHTASSIGEPMQHSDSVTSVDFSPDGKRVASAAANGTLYLWDADAGIPVGSPMDGMVRSGAANPNASRFLHFRPDGKRLLVVTSQTIANELDLQTGTKIGTPIHDENISCISYAPDGKTVAVASESKVKFWNVQSHPNTWSNAQAFIARRLQSQSYNQRIPDDEALNSDLAELVLSSMKRGQMTLAMEAYEHQNWFACIFHLERLCQAEQGLTRWTSMLGRTRAEMFAEQEKWGDAIGQLSASPKPFSTMALVCMKMLLEMSTDEQGPSNESITRCIECAEDSVLETNKFLAVRYLTLTDAPLVEWDRIRALAAAVSSIVPGGHHAHGAAHYRLGNYEEAKIELQKPFSPSGTYFSTTLIPGEVPEVFRSYYVQAFLTMTYHRLGESRESAKHQRILAQIESDFPARDWRERLERKLLRREVEQTCNSAAKK